MKFRRKEGVKIATVKINVSPTDDYQNFYMLESVDDVSGQTFIFYTLFYGEAENFD